MMEIRNEFELGVPVDEAYPLLLDLDKVVPCLPGAELGGEQDDGQRAILVTVKLGPMRFIYEGAVRITDRDAASHTATLVGEGREKRGGGTAAATIRMAVRESGAGSRVDTVADVKLTGRAAQSGRGIVEDVSKTLIGQMAATLEERYGGTAAVTAVGENAEPATSSTSAEAAPAKPIKGGRVLFSVLWSRIKRFFTRIVGRRAVR